MNEERSLFDGAMSAVTLLAGGGLITFIAAPFAVPILLFLALLAVLALPLVIVGGLVGGVVAIARRLGR
jgi:hypothetical protein